MYCKYCGAETENRDGICEKCQLIKNDVEKDITIVPEEPPKRTFCKNCGYEVTTEIICPKCKQIVETIDFEDIDASGYKIKNFLKIIFLAITLTLVILFLVITLNQCKNEDSYTNENSKNESDEINETTRENVNFKNLKLKLNDDGKSYSIIGIKDTTIKEINIPNEYNNIPITKIETCAFKDCTEITKIYITENIKHISSKVFFHCDNLKTIYISKNVEKIEEDTFEGAYEIENIIVDKENKCFSSINGSLCSKDKKTLLRGTINHSEGIYIIPESIEIIGKHAFSANPKITKIEFHNNVKAIEDKAFFLCLNLLDLETPSSLKSIGNYAFQGCYSLTNISLAEGLETIGVCAFSSCNFSTLKIPNSVTTIKDFAFTESALTKIIIPKNVTNIGKKITSYSELVKIYCEIENQPESWNKEWNSANNIVIWNYKE